MELPDSLVELRRTFDALKSDIALMRECDECTKGPCVGRLLRHDSGWVHPNSVYIADGELFVRRCSIVIKQPKLPVKIEREVNDYLLYEPMEMEFLEQPKEPGDILIRRG